MTSLQVRKMTCSALFLAVALVLPFVTGQIPEIGSRLCPMHIPALLCGLTCGWSWGLAVGFIAPPLRSALFHMPAMFPEAVAMAFELAVYGAMSGLLFHLFHKKEKEHTEQNPKKASGLGLIYTVLVISMIAGRIVWGIVRLVLAGLSGSSFTWALFLAGAFTKAIPGIILQLVLIPVLVSAIDQAGLSMNR